MTWPLRYAALALVAASSVSPQQAVRPAEPGVRFTPDLVQVDAVVTDAKGKQVTSLRPEDFEITEDGKHQTITDFAYSAAGPATPRTVVFIADTCDTSVYDRSIQTALEGFIRNHMRPGDRVSVLESLGGEGRSQQLTGDSEAAAAAAEAVGRRFVPGTPSLCREVALWFEYGQARERESAARSDSEARYHGVASFNAVVSAVEGLAGTPGQKHVVLLSELMGWTRYSRTTPAVQGLANRANRAGVVLHFVDLSGFRAPPRIVGQSRWTSSSARPRSGAAEDAAAVRNPPGVTVTTVTAPQARGKAASYLSAVTGGIISQTVFDRPVPDVATWRREVDASRAEFLKMSLDRIAANTEGHNWIGYRPPQRDVRKADRNFHQIKVTVRRRGLTVRSRGGYQGALDHSPPAAPRSREELLRAALRSTLYGPDIRLRLSPLHTAVPSRTKKGEWQPLLRAMLAIEAGDVVFEEQAGGTRKATLDIAAAAYGAGVEPAAAKSASWSVTATPEGFASLQSGSLLCSLDLPVDGAGPYIVRAAVLDRATGKTGSAYIMSGVPEYNHDVLTISGLVLSLAAREQVESTVRYERVESVISFDTPREAQPVAQVTEPPPPRRILVRANPVERVFAPGDTLTYSFEVFGARTRRAEGPSLSMRLSLFRLPTCESCFRYDPGPQPVRVREMVSPFSTGGRLVLPDDLEPGPYAMNVAVSDDAGAPVRSQVENMLFTVAKPEMTVPTPPAPSPGSQQ